jgi:GMP synthase-like glutamine amidotransferase
MRALVVQHVAVEGPGTLAAVLAQCRWELQTIKRYAGESLPHAPHIYDAIIIMGGPMSVYDESAYPFLRHEHDFLLQALTQRVPLLGICLGAQLLAKALGAHVYRNPQKEIGWDRVEITAAGQTDPLFMGLGAVVPVFQWHGDAFALPAGATLLASSPCCAHQAFRYGERVYGLLFHLELTPEAIQCWLDAFAEEVRSLRGQIDPVQIIADTPRHMAMYTAVAQRVFWHLITQIWEPLAQQRTSRAVSATLGLSAPLPTP